MPSRQAVERVAIAVLGSPFPNSSSEKITQLVLDSLKSKGWKTDIVELFELPSDALLLRSKSDIVDAALNSVEAADLVILASPTYRATYTGLMKVFFDQFPQDALRGKLALPVQTGGSADHSLTIEYGMSPMVRSLGALVLSNTIYAWGAHWEEDDSPNDLLSSLVTTAVEEVETLTN